MESADPVELNRLTRRFREAYGRHRAAEGRAADEAELLSLPYLRTGPLAPQWAVRARTLEVFLDAVVRPLALHLGRPLRVLDLGAGNGWLSFRLARLGHRPVALDLRVDSVDGLGAARAYGRHLPSMFPRIAGSFDALPLKGRVCDVAVFNASLHYALDLPRVLGEATRSVAPGGRIAVLDSPFYARDADGERMVEEKHRSAPATFGDLADDLVGLPFVEYLTRNRLEAASAASGLTWRRHRVRYPLRYEARPLTARLLGKRAPSRFDVWEASAA